MINYNNMREAGESDIWREREREREFKVIQFVGWVVTLMKAKSIRARTYDSGMGLVYRVGSRY